MQSLNEFYDDARAEGGSNANEAEFRAYYLITHLRDSDVLRQTELLPSHIFNDPFLQTALRLQSLVQRNNDTLVQRGRRAANSPASLNAFSRFFKLIAASTEVTFLLACLLETDFTDVRRGALKALLRSYLDRQSGLPLSNLAKMLGADDVEDCVLICQAFDVNVRTDEAGEEVADLHRTCTFKGELYDGT